MEYDFDELPGAPSWDVIAANVFNLYASRWNADSGTCNGGLKWQYDPKANGFTYKNSVTNGGMFQTAARLARYNPGNKTFSAWADKIWDWSSAVGLVSPDFHVYDGTSDDKGANCTSVNHDEWSYNVATYLHGAAHMYNLTGSTVWEDRVKGLVDQASVTFFSPSRTGIMIEQKCEGAHACTTDQTSFKASLSRWLGKTAVLVPSVRATVMGLLEKSAAGAAQSCVGHGNSTCGQSWTGKGFDGQSDFGVELSALETIQSLLVFEAPPFAVAHGPDTPATGTKPPTKTPADTTPTTTSTDKTPADTPAADKTPTATPAADKTSTETPAADKTPTHNNCGGRRRRSM
jgi:mannan endo-1,6-alpha-mannosidase